MALIDIIVPVYKVEKYLKDCICSVLAQTFQDWRLILVDDGSPDTCGAICDEYAKKDPRIQVIHKENGGLSSARNAGLDVSNGEYVSFIDSDDYIHPLMVEKLLHRLQSCDADISLCSFCYVDEHLQPLDALNGHSPIKEEVLTGEDALSRLHIPYYHYYVISCAKLYKRTLFDNIRFPMGKLHEDEAICHRIFYQAKRIACIPDEFYLYRQTNGSITHSVNERNVLDYIDTLWDREAFANENGLKQFQEVVRVNIWYQAIRLANTEVLYQDRRTAYKHRLTKLIPWLLETKQIPVKDKIRFLIWRYFGVILTRETLKLK